MPTIRDVMSRAVTLHQDGQLEQAETLYREVLRASPNEPDALHLLGVLANRNGRPEVAVRLIHRALRARPGEHLYHGNIGNAYKAAGDVKTAIAHYREALRLKPDYVIGHVHLSDALMEEGRPEDARAESLEALRLNPDCPQAFGTLGELAAHRHYTFTSADLDRMHQFLSAEHVSNHDGCLLNFTLAAHLERNQLYDEAFAHYRQGNEFKERIYVEDQSAFDPRRHQEHINRLIAVYTPEFFARHQGIGLASDKLVFVVGMVRSGTSLVEQILGSHPRVFGAGERKDIEWISTSLPGRLDSALSYPDCLADLNPSVIQTLARVYHKHMEGWGGPTAVRIIDKMTHNYIHLGLIALLYPRARVIHCRRDTMDVCTSAFIQNFKWLPYTARLEHIGFYYRQYERLMAHWDRVLPLPVYQVNYEEMVANQEAVSRNLVAYCGVPWHPDCLEFHKRAGTVRTASKLQVRKPMYKHAVERWRRFEAHLQPLRDALENPDSVLAAPGHSE